MLRSVGRVLALFDAPARRRLRWMMLGSTLIALAEVVAVVLVLPLMQLITSTQTDGGALGIVRRALGDPEDSTLALVLTAAVFVGFLLKGVLALAIRWWSLGFVQRVSNRTAAELLRYYLSAPFSLHVQRGSADLLRTMNDAVSQVFSLTVVGGIAAATELVTLTTLAVALLLISPVTTLVVGLYFAGSAYLLQRMVKRSARRSGELFISSAYEATRTALQSLGGIREIKLRNEQEQFVGRFDRARQAMGRAQRTSTFLGEVPKYAMEILFVLGFGIMTAVVYLGQPSSSALSVLALFAIAGFRILPSTVRLLGSLSAARAGAASLPMVERDLAAAREQPRPRPATAPMPLERELRIESVSFRYPGSDSEVLREIELSIPVGSSTALVGSSGAGKSTLVDLVLGLYQPTRGALLADGTDIRTDVPSWQLNLAVVPQDVFLLDGTVRDNIVFSPGRAPDEDRLDLVVGQAQLEGLVAMLPDGLDAPVGERGTRLSGGQAQRVGIARALYRGPRLLVLDEATSDLDNETENKITHTLGALRAGMTTLIVAHRLSTVRRCDQIVFLDGGRVSAVGTFEELLARSPGFARLVELGSLEAPAAG